LRKIIIIISILILLSGCQITSRDNIQTSKVDQNNIYKDAIDKFKKEHTDADVIYSLLADIDSDNEIECFLVTGRVDPKLWYIGSDNKAELLLEATGEYLETYLLDRGSEKHIALMSYYEPSNTQVWVYKMDNRVPKQVFYFMADWEIRVVSGGFDMIWKQYNKNSAIGGYELTADRYSWNKEKDLYIKKVGL